MTPKVLIFFPHPLRERHGGPYSFLFHLKEGLKGQTHSISFLSDIISCEQEEQVSVNSLSPLKKLIKSFIPKKTINDRMAGQWLKELVLKKLVVTKELIEQFDILHFHETIDVWRYRNILKNYTGKILLTTHTPKTYHLELIEDVWKISKDNLSKQVFKQLGAIDTYAYSKAYILVFACKEAIESYHQHWPEFLEIIKEKRVQYLPTGIKKQLASRPKHELRKQFNIPDDAFVFCFTGRRSGVKGYDLFVNAAQMLIQQNNYAYFFIVGKKEITPAINDVKWIETGWTDDVGSFIAASDLIVVPNRHTYFDLSVLETLSLGKPLLLSNTGGNKYFKHFNSPGIFYHEPDAKSLLNEMINCIDKKPDLTGYGLENEKLYEQYFRAERFAANHITLYNSIG